mmetsp:Transcript_13243/g.37629  ORF Transcript_13243/g.37629 Transcript_13243/m.37629 type:complete len:845 (+) Transcript_13243:43-2577(+)
MSKTYKLKGQWKGKSAGGCQNHPTWRYNPQLFLHVEEEKVVSIQLTQDAEVAGGKRYHIGFYVAKADDPDRRQLVMARQMLVGKAAFSDKDAVATEVTLSPGQAYVVIPCTFNPGEETGFTISFTCVGDIRLAPLPPGNEWKYIHCTGKWDGRSAAGCRNSPNCHDNPQFLLRVRRPGDVTILLSQPKTEFDVIGFYVLTTKDSEGKLTDLPSSDIVVKSEFARPTEAIVTATLDKKKQYVIVPCTFDPGHNSEFKLEIFCDSDVRLKPLKNKQEVILNGEWVGLSSGGCLNYPTWRNNPQFFLIMQQSAKVCITLRQMLLEGEEKPHSIGFYVVESFGHRVVLIKPAEIIGKGAFERKMEVSCTLSLEERKHPYSIIPCTFRANTTCKFELTVTVLDNKPPAQVLKLLPCNYVWPKKTIKHEWTPELSGGCRNNIETWLQNPTMKISLASEADVVILLSQGDMEKSIGFYVMVPKNPNQPLSTANARLVSKSVFRKDLEVSVVASLPAGEYTVVVCAFNKGETGNFTFTVYSSTGNFEMEAVNFEPLHGGDKLCDTPVKQAASKSSAASAAAVTGEMDLGKINWKDVKIGKKIGQGGYGAVYLGEWNGEKVAIKKLFRDEVDDSELETFKKEIEIMSKFSHPKIVQFLGASLQPPNICILTEYMERGNLSNVLKADPNLAWKRKLLMSKDAAEGMVYLHDQNPPVVHRDLKSLNLLVAMDFTVKVADFGLSKATSGNSLNSKVGSLNWCAPEILLQSAPYTRAGDVYSFGMVLWEMLTHEAPFKDMHPLQIVRSIDQGDLPAIPKTCDPTFADLVRACWSMDPKKRPTFLVITECIDQLLRFQ